MIKKINIRLAPHEAASAEKLQLQVCKKLGVRAEDITHINTIRRSIDARGRQVKIDLEAEVYVGEAFSEKKIALPRYVNVAQAAPVVIVGAGPAGLFAALKLLEKGLKPVIVERGKDVRTRRRDIAAINKHHFVNPDSNYCFGEGGAGTYSDGKLYTRSKKRGDIKQILEILVAHGAKADIMIDAHPHIGTNKLPEIITAIRQTIEDHGGEIHFNSRVTDLIITDNEARGVVINGKDKLEGKAVILATGHSARDIFTLLDQKGVLLEAKPFALGVRVEHPQTLVDSIQYKCASRGPHLPPAPYSIVRQVNGRGVYSFCMCPGGIIAPCATSPGEVVTNGWSPSKRDQPFANSGIVVELRPEDFKAYSHKGALAAMYFQQEVEQKAWAEAGKTQRVPAQRLVDFTKGKLSAEIPASSYHPGTASVEMRSVLPKFVYQSLQYGFKLFGKSMQGFLTNEAVVHAPESRTSSPVRIPRDPATLQHVQIKSLYPCGEGAGYAGGIVSAAMDGEKCAEMIGNAFSGR